MQNVNTQAVCHFVLEFPCFFENCPVVLEFYNDAGNVLNLHKTFTVLCVSPGLSSFFFCYCPGMSWIVLEYDILF